jgi:hypothetical protein
MAAVRMLNQEGMAIFKEYLAAARAGSVDPPPQHVLWDGAYSDPFFPDAEVEQRTFSNAFEFGRYLSEIFASCESREISRNHALWSWLALFFVDQVAPTDESGHRNVLEDALYVLDASFIFRRYYRHMVRAPWQAVRLHGENAKILLLSSGKGSRTELAEQLGAYADIFGCTTVIAAAYQLWFDPISQKPRRGSGGKGPGSPRRLAAVVRQLQLTYDLSDCPLPEFLKLLPSEFNKWLDAPTSESHMASGA